MPLIRDPAAHSVPELAALAAGFTATLVQLRDGLPAPSPHVIDPMSIETARELLDAALARMRDPTGRSPGPLAENVNLGYATMLAVIDLVKSHTDRPRVPRRSKDPDDRAAARSQLTRPRRSSRAGSGGSARSRSRSGAPSRTPRGSP